MCESKVVTIDCRSPQRDSCRGAPAKLLALCLRLIRRQVTDVRPIHTLGRITVVRTY